MTVLEKGQIALGGKAKDILPRLFGKTIKYKIVAKKARATSIYDFIEWRHLLTSGNKASFTEYKRFIERISR